MWNSESLHFSSVLQFAFLPFAFPIYWQTINDVKNARFAFELTANANAKRFPLPSQKTRKKKLKIMNESLRKGLISRI